jgi:hypothetical protein
VPASSAEKDSVHKKAEQVRAQVTDANFSDMVLKYSSDPTAKQNKGNMGVFNKAAMVAPFSVATAALKPGEISQPIETQFGWHIIQRLPYATAAADFATQYSQASMMVADSTYMAQTEKAANVQVKANAPATMKNTVKEQAKHITDRTVLATYNGGDLTVADYLGWLETFPPQQQIAQRIPTVPDSVLTPRSTFRHRIGRRCTPSLASSSRTSGRPLASIQSSSPIAPRAPLKRSVSQRAAPTHISIA